jgi:chorismate dehydratase
MSHKISCVSYLNSKPFIYGIENSRLLHEGEIELSLDIPKRCAEKLIQGEAEIGLVPVASLPLLPAYHILSKYCIGAVGAVHSVCLYSEVPLESIEEIVLDYQSMSSVNLTRILCKHHWKIHPNFVAADKDYISNIRGTRAGVVIGDRTFQLQDQFTYTYDLAEEWMHFSNLPFVFAVWVSTRKLSDAFIHSFEEALTFGIEHIPQVAGMYADQYKPYDVHKYLTHYIQYDFDEKKEKALHLYLELLKQL